jgi:uncharacterized protein involved in exopolysaccharide biosynthesis
LADESTGFVMSRARNDDDMSGLPGKRRGSPVLSTYTAGRRSSVVVSTGYARRETAQDDDTGHVYDVPDPSPLPADEPATDRNADPAAVQRAGEGSAILNLSILLRAIWRHRLLILALMAVFTVLGGLLLPTLPRKYTAQTSLYFDPRQIELSETGSQTGVSSEVIVSMINSQSKILTSYKAASEVVDTLKLGDNYIFAGVKGEPQERRAAIAGFVQRAASVALESSSYVLTLSVTTADGTVSAAIANALVEAFLDEENRAYSSLYQRTNTALDSRLRELSQEVQEAEEAVESYKASNDMVTADGNLIADQRLVQLNELLTSAQKASIEAKARMDAASSLKLEDAISTSSQPQVSAALTDLRRQYATQAAAVGSLESALGARHPTLLAAKASLRGLKTEIEAELERNRAAARADLAQAQQSEQQVAKELSVQKSLQNNTQQRQVGLNDLQRRATAAREIYEAVLKRVRETSEEKNLANSNIRVLSEASTPSKADGPGRSILLVAGLVGGALAGLGLGILIALTRSLATNPRLRANLTDLTRAP